MAYVICKKHGGNAAPLLCLHLREALQSGAPLPAVFYIEAWYLGSAVWAHNVCAACAGEAGIVEPRTIWKDDDALDRLFAIGREVAPVCARCFDEANQVA
ncbi:MAG TPA: hypothetical protein VFE47_01440 [Tepidisphaeraceae bacterium]|jgi:hypothetical protein|nr:hypothetical protein [Tepidisphaeraceae bacterium]